MKKIIQTNWPRLLLIMYIAEFILLGISPFNRVIWCTENAISVLIVSILCLMYRRGIRFSNLAYTLVALYIYLHTIGGYYSFENVPFGWITETFNFERNHFDRICHFMVGSFAIMILEFCESRKIITSRPFAVFFAIFTIFGVAAIFELVEWTYAELADSESGALFLGSQGDIWDAQKDMLADGLGAICVSLIYIFANRRKVKKIND